MSRVHGVVLGLVCHGFALGLVYFGVVDLPTSRAAPANPVPPAPSKPLPASRAAPANPVPPAPSKPPAASRDGMVLLPAGSFDMGSNNGPSTEKPVHRVSVSAFWMDVTEVTANAYATCVKKGGCSADKLKCSDYATYGVADKGNHPINCVDWNQATAYCRWAKKRLPTEEEWEYAARGTDGRTYPWGNDEPASQLCWNRWVSKQGTCAVGSFPADKSPFGLFDMVGNVWEWTSSGWSDDYSKNRNNKYLVYRGGSWSIADADGVRASVRNGDGAGDRNNSVGFRCARSVLPVHHPAKARRSALR